MSTKNKRPFKILALIALLAFVLTMPATVLADNGNILDKVKQAQGNDSITRLETKAEDVADKFVKFLRNTAVIVAVVMFILVSYSLLFSPNVKTIAECKGKVSALVLSIAVAVMAEEIVGTLLGWFS